MSQTIHTKRYLWCHSISETSLQPQIWQPFFTARWFPQSIISLINDGSLNRLDFLIMVDWNRPIYEIGLIEIWGLRFLNEKKKEMTWYGSQLRLCGFKNNKLISWMVFFTAMILERVNHMFVAPYFLANILEVFSYLLS